MVHCTTSAPSPHRSSGHICRSVQAHASAPCPSPPRAWNKGGFPKWATSLLRGPGPSPVEFCSKELTSQYLLLEGGRLRGRGTPSLLPLPSHQGGWVALPSLAAGLLRFAGPSFRLHPDMVHSCQLTGCRRDLLGGRGHVDFAMRCGLRLHWCVSITGSKGATCELNEVRFPAYWARHTLSSLHR